MSATILGTRALSTPSPSEREDIKRELLLAIGNLYTLDSLAHNLDDLYTKALVPAKE